MRIVEICKVRDPDLAAATGVVYERVYTNPETAWPGHIFRPR